MIRYMCLEFGKEDSAIFNNIFSAYGLMKYLIENIKRQPKLLDGVQYDVAYEFWEYFADGGQEKKPFLSLPCNENQIQPSKKTQQLIVYVPESSPTVETDDENSRDYSKPFDRDLDYDLGLKDSQLDLRFIHCTTQNAEASDQQENPNFKLLQTMLMKVVGSNKPEEEYIIDNTLVLKVALILKHSVAQEPIILRGESGCGKTSLIEYLTKQLDIHKTDRYSMVKCHPGISKDDFLAEFEKINENAKNNEGKTVWVLFDEMNTSPYQSLILDYMEGSEVTVNMKRSKNVFCIGTTNPYKRLKKETKTDNNEDGEARECDSEDEDNELSHKVEQTHIRCKNMLFDFDQLNQSAYRLFIKLQIKKSRPFNEEAAITEDPKLAREELFNVLADVFDSIVAYQGVDGSMLTRRNILHMLDLYDAFIELDKKCKPTERKSKFFNKMPELGEDLHRVRLWNSIRIAWFFKFNNTSVVSDRDNRKFGDHKTALLEYFFDSSVDVNSLDRVMYFYAKDLVRLYNAQLDIEEKVNNKNRKKAEEATKTEEKNGEQEANKTTQTEYHKVSSNVSLLENLTAIIMCIKSNNHCFIYGRPGTGKTVSYKIMKYLTDKERIEDMSKNKNLRKKNPSAWAILESLGEVEWFTYAGSKQTKPELITDLFEKKLLKGTEGQQSKKKILMFDEVGLAESSPYNPLKSLNHYLDVCRENNIMMLAFSNIPLDQSKQNRMVVVRRGSPSDHEIKQIFQMGGKEPKDEMGEEDNQELNEMTEESIQMGEIEEDDAPKINNNREHYQKYLDIIAIAYLRYKYLIKHSLCKKSLFHENRDLHAFRSLMEMKIQEKINSLNYASENEKAENKISTEEMRNLLKSTIEKTFSGKWEEFGEKLELNPDIDERIVNLFRKEGEGEGDVSGKIHFAFDAKIDKIIKEKYLDKLSNRNFIDLFKHIYHEESPVQTSEKQESTSAKALEDRSVFFKRILVSDPKSRELLFGKASTDKEDNSDIIQFLLPSTLETTLRDNISEDTSRFMMIFCESKSLESMAVSIIAKIRRAKYSDSKGDTIMLSSISLDEGLGKKALEDIKSNFVKEKNIILNHNQEVADTLYDIINQKSHLVGQKIDSLVANLYLGEASIPAIVPVTMRLTFVRDASMQAVDRNKDQNRAAVKSDEAFLTRFQKVSCRLGDFVDGDSKMLFEEYIKDIYLLAHKNQFVNCLSPSLIISILFENSTLRPSNDIEGHLYYMMSVGEAALTGRNEFKILKFNHQKHAEILEKTDIIGYLQAIQTDLMSSHEQKRKTDLDYKKTTDHLTPDQKREREFIMKLNIVTKSSIKDIIKSLEEKENNLKIDKLLLLEDGERKSETMVAKELDEKCSSSNLMALHNKENTKTIKIVAVLDFLSAKRLHTFIKNYINEKFKLIADKKWNVALRICNIICIDKTKDDTQLFDQMKTDIGLNFWNGWHIRCLDTIKSSK